MYHWPNPYSHSYPHPHHLHDKTWAIASEYTMGIECTFRWIQILILIDIRSHSAERLHLYGFWQSFKMHPWCWEYYQHLEWQFRYLDGSTRREYPCGAGSVNPRTLFLHKTLHCFLKTHKTTTFNLWYCLVNPGLQSHHPSCKDDKHIIDEGHDGNRCSLDQNPVAIAEFGHEIQERQSRRCIFIHLLLGEIVFVVLPIQQIPHLKKTTNSNEVQETFRRWNIWCVGVHSWFGTLRQWIISKG